MALVKLRPCHATARGRPTLTETSSPDEAAAGTSCLRESVTECISLARCRLLPLGLVDKVPTGLYAIFYTDWLEPTQTVRSPTQWTPISNSSLTATASTSNTALG